MIQLITLIFLDLAHNRNKIGQISLPWKYWPYKKNKVIKDLSFQFIFIFIRFKWSW